MTLIKFFWVAMSLFVGLAHANDAALYSQQPSPDSSFIRFVNIESHKKEFAIKDLFNTNVSAYSATKYAPIDSGRYTVTVSKTSKVLDIEEKKKVTVFIKQGDISSVIQEANSNKRAANLALINLSDAISNLSTAKSGKSVLPDVAAFSHSERKLNPLKMSFKVEPSSDTAVHTEKLTLKRGLSTDIIFFDNVIEGQVLITESEW